MTGHIYIYGEVGKQVTLDTVLKAIAPTHKEYAVHIHSPGGDVFEGYAIYNALKNTGKEITVYVEGVCASIATLIAAAGDKIIMNKKAQFMIHNPRITSMGGEAKDLRSVAGQLDKIKSQLIESWVGRTNLSQEQLSQLYDNETWLTPEQAVEMGFADEVQESLKAVAYADIKKYTHMKDKRTLSAIIADIKNLFSPKNLALTLDDGRVVSVPEEGELSNQPITLEDGSPLEDGTFKLASGEQITVAGGIVTEVVMPEAKTEEKKPETENSEDMTLKDELAKANARAEAAEARIKELESAVQAKTQEAVTAESKAKTFENKLNTEVKNLREELKKFENTTVGDTKPPKKAEKPTSSDEPVVADPMRAFFRKNILEKRNTD